MARSIALFEELEDGGPRQGHIPTISPKEICSPSEREAEEAMVTHSKERLSMWKEMWSSAISVDKARQDYGVAIDSVGRVNIEATRKLRLGR